MNLTIIVPTTTPILNAVGNCVQAIMWNVKSLTTASVRPARANMPPAAKIRAKPVWKKIPNTPTDADGAKP